MKHGTLGKNKIEQWEIDRLIYLYTIEQKSLSAIADELKITSDTVKRHLKLNNIQIRIAQFYLKTEITPEIEASIINDYNNYVAKNIICAKYKIRENTLTNFLISHNLPLERENRTVFDSLTEKQIEEIIKLYEEGRRPNEVREMLSFKCSETIFYKVLKENNVSLNKYKNNMAGTHFYKLWIERYGQEIADEKMKIIKENWSKSSSGKNNPMFGVPSPMGSGVGYKGWYKGVYFRSLREVSYLIHLDENNIPWEPAEKKKYEISYVNWDGADRTYRPDFLINSSTLIEIKPKRLHKSPNVTAKRLAAEAWCKENNLNYSLIDFPINSASILTNLNSGIIKFGGDYESKFRDYLSKSA